LGREEPDPLLRTVEQTQLLASYRHQEGFKGKTPQGQEILEPKVAIPEETVNPLLEAEDYPSSVATKHQWDVGDPRALNNGETFLVSLEKASGSITPYHEWKRDQLPETTSSEERKETVSTVGKLKKVISKVKHLGPELRPHRPSLVGKTLFPSNPSGPKPDDGGKSPGKPESLPTQTVPVPNGTHPISGPDSHPKEKSEAIDEDDLAIRKVLNDWSDDSPTTGEKDDAVHLPW
jgi:hypothetical protein